MTEKNKRFPLPLSSIADRKDKPNSSRSFTVAVPQTTIKNPIKHVTHKSVVKPSAPIERFVSDDIKSACLASGPLRHAMVERLKKQGISDPLIIAAMKKAPRHLFVQPAFSAQAYVDASIPIGHQQTISQPYIVARMLEAMCDGKKLSRVLEIGTGCGYQACVLSHVAKEVFSMERIRFLHELAKSNLRFMRIANIRLQYGDGMLGLPQVAPFDGIILAAAGLEVPPALLDQLAVGGRLVAPVGGRSQELHLIERLGAKRWTNTVLEKCHFVPLHAGVI